MTTTLERIANMDLASMPDTVAIRSLLLAELETLRSGAEQETRTMRNLWYALVKPALSRAGILNKKTSGDKDVAWANKLSSELAALVRDGETTYEELRIVDGSRQRSTSSPATTPVVDVTMVGAHFPHVVLFIEKDSMWPAAETVASLYGCSAVSGKGQPSLAATENMVIEILEHPSFEGQTEIVILALTDYDPYGYKISDSIHNQLSEAAQSLSKAGRTRNLQAVKIERLGLYDYQLTAEERAKNAYEPKDGGLAKWFAQTGGVDGQPLGIELDALPMSRIRTMFAEGIEQVIDIGKLEADMRRAYVELIAVDMLRPEFERKRAALTSTVRSNGLHSRIEAVPLPRDLLRRAADAGLWYVNPISLRLFPDSLRADIVAAMGSTLDGLAPVQP